ncbi:polysaccharide deacetylase [mine drainage metagenome]|uniref:Polysaccharide deacetylase n=1 Tax=mine drainage metagenome TaxID=410659 RepID=A0A1J5SFC7_9ZZZZ
MAMLAQLLMRALAPAGPRAKLSIFIFHRVLPKPDPHLPWEPDAVQFDWVLGLIAGSFNLLPLGEAVRRLAAGSLPAAAAAITFDDGYADNLSVAAPILKRHGATATFFIATGFLDGGRMWNDDVIEAFRCAPRGIMDLEEFDLGIHEITDPASRVKAYGGVLGRLKYFDHDCRAGVARAIARSCGLGPSPELMLTSAQVLALRAQQMEIGAHTHSHPILELMSDARAENEMRVGRARLESLLGEAIELFAYPNGVLGKDFSVRHGQMARRLGFTAAVSTSAGAASRGADLFQLPRFTPWDRTPLRFALRCSLNLSRPSSEARILPVS